MCACVSLRDWDSSQEVGTIMEPALTPESTVVYEGVLELGKDATAGSLSSRDWNTRLFVLRRDPTTQIASLSCYKDIKRKWNKQKPKAVLQLYPTFEVSLAHTSGYKFPLKLSVSDNPPLILAASNYHLMNTWIYHLQTQRLLVDKWGTHTFSVEAQDGTHMNMIGARGDCKLAITRDSELLCALASTRQIVGVWPFNTLRRYWCGDGIFGFEAGKRSPRGEGIFTFISSQDEEIYATMKRYIEKAKQATLQRKRYEQGKVEKLSDVNTRPKLPLPREVTSPVLSSGSDDEMATKGNEIEEDYRLQYESIPAQRDDLVGVSPLAYPPPLKRGISLHTDISGPSPAYVLKRSQTSKPRRVQQWVSNTEEAMQELDEDQMMELGSSDPQDNMYSRTQHIMPAPFHQHAADHNIIDESSYHTLVHNGKPATMKGRRGRGKEEEGDSLYSLAYPPTEGATRGSEFSSNEYGTLERDSTDFGGSRTRTLSNLPLAPAKTAGEREEMENWRSVPHYPLKYSVSPPPAPTNDRSTFEDSMTDNPMYNSQADMLEALANSEREARTASPERPGELEREGGQPEELEREGGRPGGLEREGGRPGGLENERGLDSELTEEERDRNIEGAEIQRDSKGYSKVDKSKKKKVSEVNMDIPDLEAPPPPLPPRLYEGAEDEPGLQSHCDAMKESPSPTSECHTVPVSDV